ncbi:MAG: efflux RND transporter permease subunit, partial [Candidatus Cloacimonetes bacterium]|nr:efflux RND transporter permease subunit [Candidatus Cloacimonadota bacterium]
MKLTELALKKPVSMTMIYLAIILISVYAVNHIPLSLLPDLSYPRLTIVSLWRDASPEEVEANITAQIEAVGGTIPGIVNIKSTSSRERSVVNLEFTRNTDMEFARFELNEKLQLLKDILPDEVNPLIQPYLPREFRETEFLQYGLSGDYQTEELNKILEKNFKFRISALEGVSAFEITGYRDKIIKVIIDPPEITGITPAQVEEKIREHGKRVSLTGLDDDGLSKILIIEDHYRELAELQKLQLINAQKLPVTLGEIARFEQVFKEPFQLLRYNGSPQLVMTIQKEPDANAIRLARQIKNIVNEQKQNLSADLELIILEDEAREITSDLNILMQRGIFSLVIIFIVLLLFLREISSTALIILTIFFSSALTLILMFYLKIGLNMLSLAGLALGFGMMVDNSIVVFENIYRYLQKGIPAFSAALQGVREVALPISASTLTTVIVFAPFLYLHGDLKTFYLPFVYAMILSLISSLFVSFTFIPLAALKIFTSRPDQITPVKISHYDPELTFYQKILKFLLRFRWIWTLIIVFLLAVTVWTFINKIEKGFVWTFPSDDYLGIQISLPVGSNINQTDSVARMFEDKIL